MEIPIQFRLLLKWKNLFNDLNKSPKVSISKEGKGVKSVLFLLPESIQEAKLAHYLVKVDNIEPGYTFGYVCNEKSKNYYPNSSNVKFMTYRDIDLNYFGTIKSKELLDHIKSINYDALVDLNTNFCAATSMLAFEINSKLKIGFDSIIANKIYTIVLEQNQEGFLESNFKMIKRLLGIRI